MSVARCCVAALAWAACASLGAAAAAAAPKYSEALLSAGKKPSAVDYNTQKIVGGRKVSIQLHPSMAEIGIVNGKHYAHQCGATILDKRHILTAAHCCHQNRDPKIYRVRVGSDYWASGGQLVGLTNIWVHPKYNKGATFDYDVAVLKVDKDIVFGAAVQKVDLVPTNQRVVTGTPITAVGWGYTDELHSKPLPAKLRHVQVSTIDQSECNSDVSSFGLKVTPRMFCGMEFGKDSCQGDSGGPVINAMTGKQMGIVSWGMGCAQMGSPSVFVNLADSVLRSFIAESQRK